MIPPLHLAWSNVHIEGYGSSLFNFAWPFLEIFLAIWMFGVIVAVITRLFGGVMDIISARYKSRFLYWITGDYNFLPQEDRDEADEDQADEYDEYHEPGLLEWAWALFTGRTRNRWFDYNAAGIHTEKGVNPWYCRLASLVANQEIDRYVLKARYGSHYDKVMNAMWIMTGDQRYRKSRPKPTNREFNLWLYTLFGIGRPPKKEQNYNFWLYTLFGIGRPPQKRRKTKFNFWLYTFLGIGRPPRGGGQKQFKPSLMMWYLTRDKRYLGGGLTPAFWPDVISEGFYLAFMGRPRRSKKGQGRLKRAQRSRRHRQRLAAREAGVIRRGARRARIERQWNEGSLDYHLRGPVRVRNAESKFGDNPRLFKGDFGKYRYKIGFGDDGSLQFAYLYGKKRLLAGWEIDEAGAWNPVNSPRYNFQHRAILERIIGQIQEKGR